MPSIEDKYQLCANLHLAECNWLVETDPVAAAVHVVRLDPHPAQRDGDTKAMAAFAIAEKAKRRLIVELNELNLPIVGRAEDPQYGLAFDLLSSEHEKVFTGHDNGVITLDLAEGDDVHREQLRDRDGRAVPHDARPLPPRDRALLLLPAGQPVTRAHRNGSTSCSAIRTPTTRPRSTVTTANGAPAGWDKTFVSSYATMHPAEDWAETFAHYLHIRDTLDTSAAFGFAPSGAGFDRRVLGPSGFDTIIEMWLPLAWALNMVNRSMGKEDLYPFVLPPAGAREDEVHPHDHRRARVGNRFWRLLEIGVSQADSFPVDRCGSRIATCRSMIRTLRVRLGVGSSSVPLPLSLAACGSTIKPEGAAQSVVDLVSEKTDFKPDDVKCPDGIEAKVGVTFDCKFTGPDGDYVAHMKILEVKGDTVQFDIKTELDK